MALYQAKIKDADLDYQWKHPSDIKHPLQPDEHDMNNKLPPYFTRGRSIAKPPF